MGSPREDGYTDREIVLAAPRGWMQVRRRDIMLLHAIDRDIWSFCGKRQWGAVPLDGAGAANGVLCGSCRRAIRSLIRLSREATG